MELIPKRPPTDREIELLLDEFVEADDVPSLPKGFGERVMDSRPFAPWEVRRSTFWKVPAALLGLFTASAAVLGLAPLFRLGPRTALWVWTDLLAASLVRPVAALAETMPLLSRGVSKALVASPGALPIVAAAALMGLIPLVYTLRALRPFRRRSRARDAARPS